MGMKLLKETSSFKLFIKSNDIIIYIKAKNIYNFIGKLNYSTLAIETVRNPKKHLFHKYNGYGFNAFIIDNANRIRYIDLSIDACTYRIPIQYWKENSVRLKIHDYEEQYVFPYLLMVQFAI